MTTGALRSEVIGAELSNTQHGSWNEGPSGRVVLPWESRFVRLSRFTEDWIHLLGDSDKGSSPTQFLQFSSPYICACRPDAS